MPKFTLPKIFANPIPRKSDPDLELYDPRKHGVRQSTLSTWMTCREMCRLNTILGWKSTLPRVPLIYGTISHSVIKSYTRAIRDGGISLEDARANINTYISIAENEWRDEVKVVPFAAEEIVESSLAIQMGKLPEYFSYWYEADNEVKWSLVEDKYQVDLKMPDGETVPLIGTFDATYMKGNDLWLFETKNKARWSSNIGDYLPMDLQVGIYLTALRVVYDQSPVGVRYNLVRRPGERRKKTESLMDFAGRIRDNVVADPAHYFQRLDIEFTDSEKEEYMRRTIKMVTEFYLWWKETVKNVNTRDLMWNSNSCEGKFGVCPMLDMCSKGETLNYKRDPIASADGLTSYE